MGGGVRERMRIRVRGEGSFIVYGVLVCVLNLIFDFI